ncbi:hypothetical protein E1A91_A11G219800v1 [Gossypium mustelinum]|uniref:Uncharacterized protein n=1 Tax=Gossypium mustelinum TaxID=34275 RepID=A0A5D2XCN9_GOSMU|nr:hypothetical protein E1A91_A11G219800v1 [Gossypium mustelinum]
MAEALGVCGSRVLGVPQGHRFELRGRRNFLAAYVDAWVFATYVEKELESDTNSPGSMLKRRKGWIRMLLIGGRV